MTTIRDVAKLAGVGIGTASRAISGKGSVSLEKRRRIEEAVEMLSFRPSSVAQSLSSKRLGIIGLLLPKFGSLFWELILATVEDELRAHGKYFVVATGNGIAQEKASFEFLLARDCDGILIFSSQITERSLIELEGKFPRVAVINRIVPTIEEKCFAVDHVEGGRLAARTLLDAGHTAIAVISGPLHRPDARQRHEGFLHELREAGIRIDTDLIVEGDFTAERGWRFCDALLDREKPFSALFCANDNMAISVLSRLQERGKRVPQDVAVIGYDNLTHSPFLTPPLTSVDTALEATVRSACRYLLKVCYGIDSEFQRQFMPHVVRRGSV
jgi:LacI family transcriptional regulator